MKLLVACVIAVLLTSSAVSAACRDAKGHFAKCLPPGSGTTAAMSPAVTRDAKGKCHAAVATGGTKKGQFIPCPK